MNQIVGYVLLTYGTSFLYKYSVEYFTSFIVRKTTKVVKKGVKKAWNKANHIIEPKELIEYELLDIDVIDNNETVYVNSKMRKKSIDSSWISLD